MHNQEREHGLCQKLQHGDLKMEKLNRAHVLLQLLPRNITDPCKCGHTDNTGLFVKDSIVRNANAWSRDTIQTRAISKAMCIARKRIYFFQVVAVCAKEYQLRQHLSLRAVPSFFCLKVALYCVRKDWEDYQTLMSQKVTYFRKMIKLHRAVQRKILELSPLVLFISQ